MADSWQDFRDRLAQELAGLPADGGLLVSEPDGAAPTSEEVGARAGTHAPDATAPDATAPDRTAADGTATSSSRRWWQRRGSGQRTVPGRYVQFQHWGDFVRAECISGAYRDVTPEQHAALLALGWSDPATHPAQWATENYVHDAPPAALGELAALCARSLEVLGADPAGPWTWQVND